VAEGVGIEALNAYCGVASLGVMDIFRGRRLDPERFGNLMMERRSIALPFEDSITNAVNAAKPIVDALSPQERARIEVLVTSSESGIDYSKSIASYVHEHLGLSRNCRFVEVKQACYAATAAVQMAVGYVMSGLSPGAKVLVIATDITLVDGGYAEPSMGTGGVAVLVSDKPEVMKMDLGAFGNYSYEVFDTARPTAELDVGDTDRSLFTYLDCLSNSYQDYARKVDGVDFATTFDYLALHTPFAGLVKAGHRKMMWELKKARPAEVEADFARRVMPSLAYPSVVGNMCSGSVYLALASIIDRARPTSDARVGLFSYGSGCASEFFSGVIGAGSVAAVAKMDIGGHLERRCPLTFAEYEQLIAENLRCLVPVSDKEVDVDAHRGILARVRDRKPMLALRRVKGFHRQYDWV
jgi:polyketide biosynthesis 3-hydroxy-3-methylglutaryl-CoA synthase-like enzyme PksG